MKSVFAHSVNLKFFIGIIRLFLLSTLFVCYIGTSMAQQSVKDAIKYAEIIFKNIDEPLLIDTDLHLTECGYLMPPPQNFVIENIDGLSFDTRKIAFIPPGAYTFGFRRIINVQGATTGNQATQGNVSVGFSYTPTTQVQSKLLPVEVVIEAGKYYTTEYEIIRTKGFFKEDSISVFITEITDPVQLAEAQKKVEMLRLEQQNKYNVYQDHIKRKEAYLAYQKENPARLEGTWKGETKRAMNTFYIQYTFEGDKMTYEGKSKQAGMRPYVMEGHFRFNENTIIFTPEKSTNKGQEVKNFKSKHIWYYTLTDNILHLEGGGTIGSTLIWETDGEFYKTN